MPAVTAIRLLATISKAVDLAATMVCCWVSLQFYDAPDAIGVVQLTYEGAHILRATYLVR